MVAIKRTVDDGNPPRFFTGTLVSDQYVVTTANVVDKKAVAGYNKNHFRATTFKQPIKKMEDIKEMHSYGFCTPVTQRQVLIKINFQAPKTIQTNY